MLFGLGSGPLYQLPAVAYSPEREAGGKMGRPPLFLLSFSLGLSLKSDTNAWPTGLPTATDLLGSYRDCVALE